MEDAEMREAAEYVRDNCGSEYSYGISGSRSDLDHDFVGHAKALAADYLSRVSGEGTAKELADLRAENLRLQKLMTGDPEEIEAHFAGNEGNVSLQHWAVRLIAYSLWKTFEEDGGVNFLTVEVGGLSDKGPMEVTLRPSWGTKTPTQLLIEEKAKTAELQKDLATIRVPADAGMDADAARRLAPRQCPCLGTGRTTVIDGGKEYDAPCPFCEGE